MVFAEMVGFVESALVPHNVELSLSHPAEGCGGSKAAGCGVDGNALSVRWSHGRLRHLQQPVAKAPAVLITSRRVPIISPLGMGSPAVAAKS
jgi:hypothetical protein